MGITTTTPTSTATPTKTQIDIFFLRPLQTTIVTKDYGHQKNNKYFIFVYCPLFAHLESLLGGWLWGSRWKSVQRKAIAAPHIETASSWSIGLMSKTSASISSWRQLLVYVSSLWHHVWSHLLCSAGWSWRLELELCERKILLPGWWLEAGAGRKGEGFTVALEGWSPAERSKWLLYYMPRLVGPCFEMKN